MKYLIHNIFKILICGIIIATIFLDKNISVLFPNTVRWNNAGYFLIAAILLYIVVHVLNRVKLEDINKNIWLIATSAIFLCTAFIQLVIAIWAPVEVGADFYHVRSAAMEIVDGGGEGIAREYFRISPNNVNITLIFALFYYVFGNWRVIIYLGSLFVNISVLLIAVTVVNITGKHICGLLVQIIGVLLMALSWRSFLPYTDNFGMIFVALLIWIYFSNFHGKVKLPLLIVIGVLGSFVKITVFLILLAIGMHYLFVELKNKKVKEIIIRMFCISGVTLLCFIVFAGLSMTLKEHFQYRQAEESKSWHYLLMVGQNTEAIGVVNSADKSLREKIIEENPEGDWNNEFVKEAIRRVVNRGIVGNVKFYLKKLNVAYNDGYFHNARSFSDKLDENMLYRIYIDNNTLEYQIAASIMQVSWNMILLLIIINAFWSRKNQYYSDIVFFAEITIIGITTYLMMFEGRAKYLFMFLPAYLFLAGIAMKHLMDFGSVFYKKIITKKDA